MTIYEIKRRVEAGATGNLYFFSRDTMKFFGQTLKDFSVAKLEEGKYLIIALIKSHGKVVPGVSTKRIFNANTNKLENYPSEYEGTEGQDRESYTDTQDRESYSVR